MSKYLPERIIWASWLSNWRLQIVLTQHKRCAYRWGRFSLKFYFLLVRKSPRAFKSPIRRPIWWQYLSKFKVTNWWTCLVNGLHSIFYLLESSLWCESGSLWVVFSWHFKRFLNYKYYQMKLISDRFEYIFSIWINRIL